MVLFTNAGKETPDFSQFQLESVEILDVTRHNRKIRTGSLQGNAFEIFYCAVQKESDELNERLNFVAKYGFLTTSLNNVLGVMVII